MHWDMQYAICSYAAEVHHVTLAHTTWSFTDHSRWVRSNEYVGRKDCRKTVALMTINLMCLHISDMILNNCRECWLRSSSFKRKYGNFSLVVRWLFFFSSSSSFLYTFILLFPIMLNHMPIDRYHLCYYKRDAQCTFKTVLSGVSE